MLRIRTLNLTHNQEGRDPLHKFIDMKKEVILKATEMLKRIEDLEKIIGSFSSVKSLEFRDPKEYGILSIELGSGARQSVYFNDSPVITPELDSILQETAERCLSLFKIKLLAEKNRLEASLESFNEEDFYRSQLFNKIGEAK
jgi:hypothetical protein